MVEPVQPKYIVGEGTEIWSGVRKGNRDAFESLFQKYYEDLFHYALKLTGQKSMAEDQVQKLFLKIWQKKDNLREVDAVKTYLWTALRRSIIDTYRKRKTERKYLDQFAEDQFEMHFSVEELIINDEKDSIQSDKLKEAIDQLSPKQREVLYLKFYEGMSYQEIEQIMSVNYQSCRNYVYRAIESLRSMLESEVLVSMLLMEISGMI